MCFLCTVFISAWGSNYLQKVRVFFSSFSPLLKAVKAENPLLVLLSQAMFPGNSRTVIGIIKVCLWMSLRGGAFVFSLRSFKFNSRLDPAPHADALLSHKGGVQLMAERQITSLPRIDDMILNFSPSHLLLTWVLYILLFLFFLSRVWFHLFT